MISCDTDLFIHAYNLNSPFHQAARDFFINHSSNRELVISELVLVERPLNGQKAVQVCRQYRANKNWMVIDYPGYLMKEVWEYAAQPGRGRHPIFNGRLAFTLRHYGVKEFATRNVKHFQDFGFSRVWDPLA